MQVQNAFKSNNEKQPSSNIIIFYFIIVLNVCCMESKNRQSHLVHGRALEGSDPHELAGGFEVCQMKGTHIGTS